MQARQENQLKYEIRFPRLPLAVYREVAAHLRQVEGVDAGLYPATWQEFDYDQSQIGGLWLQYSSDAGLESRERVSQILAYYQDGYGALESLNSPTEL